LPAQKPEATEEAPLDPQVLKDLHTLLLEVFKILAAPFVVIW
jgi:hypothetical protein